MYLHAVNDDQSIPRPDTIQANARVCIKDLDSGEVFTFDLVPPEDRDAGKGKISIRTSLGAALIGKDAGTVVTWRAPSGLRRFEVESVSRAG